MPACHRIVSTCLGDEKGVLASQNVTPPAYPAVPTCSSRPKPPSLSFALWPRPQVLAAQCVDISDILPDIPAF